ncbi:MAG: hypothetical protein HKO59_10495 [Phycisphaerales bacterium]|nr:hypothetical protein [Phycisphaerae bacterium]NNF44196.1 hypothetical protein [Phycisphaerales bacterium]NNM26391.1 hypothetical protein [Phycisphaerales bacterium]
MHEQRNFVMVILLIVGLVWGLVSWLMIPDDAPLRLLQRVASTLLVVSMAAWLLYALKFADKLPDHLREIVGEMYYGSDGVVFMPTVRAKKGQAELCVYYQNRFENPAEVIVHLRPPEDSFIIRPGVRDVHFAFRTGGGDFGMIHQPIAVPDHLQGEVINVQLAAATHFPRSHGTRLRRNPGLTCGSLLVDWSGAAFKTGVHEVSGEIDLQRPATLHLSMPEKVNAFTTGEGAWRQERIVAGQAE